MIKADPYSELLEAFAELSRRYPAWRFGQLVANVADWADQPVWDAEDADLLRAVRLHLEQADATASNRVHA